MGFQQGGLFETREPRVAAGDAAVTSAYIEVFAEAGGTESFRLIYADGSERYEVAVEESN